MYPNIGKQYRVTGKLISTNHDRVYPIRTGMPMKSVMKNIVSFLKQDRRLKARQEVGSVMSSLPRYRDCHLSPGQSRFFTTLVKATPEMKTMEQAIRQAGGGK
jgi:mRNA-degrading endonuclease YafQ of YafQ-DinJ toxin-antitoxin module